jgi:hypothetical protein
VVRGAVLELEHGPASMATAGSVQVTGRGMGVPSCRPAQQHCCRRYVARQSSKHSCCYLCHSGPCHWSTATATHPGCPFPPAPSAGCCPRPPSPAPPGRTHLLPGLGVVGLARRVHRLLEAVQAHQGGRQAAPVGDVGKDGARRLVQRLIKAPGSSTGGGWRRSEGSTQGRCYIQWRAPCHGRLP